MPSSNQPHQIHDQVESITSIKHPCSKFYIFRDLYNTSCGRSVELEGDGT